MLQTCPSSSSFSRLLSSSSSSLDEDSLSSSALRHKRKNQNLLCSWFHKDHLTCPEGEGTSTLTQPEKNAVHRGLTSCRWLECQNVLGSSTAADPESARQCWEHQIHSVFLGLSRPWQSDPILGGLTSLSAKCLSPFRQRDVRRRVFSSPSSNTERNAHTQFVNLLDTTTFNVHTKLIQPHFNLESSAR